MKYDVIIGLEIHTELKTKSKMFCSCLNEPHSEVANRNTCPICLGHPGTLPNPNRSAIESGLLLGLALNCQINKFSKFDRKNYYYPDLPKGYQISQYDLPLAFQGKLQINAERSIDITRIHLEEDTGKLSHGKSESLIDYNRAGAPLLEMVTEPVIANTHEAKKFCQRFQQILRYLNISDAEMEKGQMRCEANVSVQVPGSWEYRDGQILPTGESMLNAKVEVKNINSFKALEKAINFEVERQSRLIDNRERISAETRGWDDNINETVSQRKKESQADYRYFPEPDIPPLVISDEWLNHVKSLVIELPDVKVARLKLEYGFSEEDAEILANDPALANLTEEVVSELYAWVNAQGDDYARQELALAKTACNWIITELLKHLKINDHSVKDIKFTAENLAQLILLLYQNKINSSAGQIIFNQMYQVGGDPIHIMRDMNLEQNNDEDELRILTAKALEAYPTQVEEYRQGKTSLMQFFVGKVMAESKGKANPKYLPNIIDNLINGIDK